jgi:putative DNA primase/helicase
MNDEPSPVEKVLERLEEYTERRDMFRARCPAHNGTSADSLSVKEGDDGRALLICHTGCELQDICDALGISVVDLFVHSESENGATKKVTKKTTRKTKREDSKDNRVLTTDDLPDGTYWEFKSPSGEVLYIQRHKREYYRRVGDGLWKKGLDGMAQVLYNLPELIDGVRAGQTIYHLEGPKDVETARERLGVVATTSGGTNSWRSSYREHYISADVVVISDNDEPGRKYSAEVAQSISAVVRSVKVVDLPDLEEGGDLTDWLDAGHTGQEFFAAVEKAL